MRENNYEPPKVKVAPKGFPSARCSGRLLRGAKARRQTGVDRAGGISPDPKWCPYVTSQRHSRSCSSRANAGCFLMRFGRRRSSGTSSPTTPRRTASAKRAIYKASWCLKFDDHRMSFERRTDIAIRGCHFRFGPNTDLHVFRIF